ncbi:MAG: hypothetical protein Q7S39_01350 [Ignavibacteria bacterium]|nr:hypothetical protein [Ignavibacteria bacterium]
MIFYRIATVVFSILLLQSCVDKKEEQKANLVTPKSEFKNFLFVGAIKDKTGLYKYNLDKKVYEPYWSDKREEVVEVSYSDKMQNVFFITAKKFGKAGAFPFINHVKLYLVDPETRKINFIEEIGSGLQVFSQWENENNFRIIINSFDKTVANYVNRRSMLFNIYGKKLEDVTEIFDIIKQGYPQTPEKKIDYISPDREYSIESRGEDSIAVYLKENKTEKLVIKSSQQIKQVEWENDLLLLSTINMKPDNESLYTKNSETSKLIIYSLEKDEILRMWEGSGIKNFFVAGDFLVFDDGFSKDSNIIIYDFRSKKIYDKIKIDDGCGLRNIPQIPDYGV